MSNDLPVGAWSPVPLRVRLARADDQAFFADLYRSSRDDLRSLLADPRYIDGLVAMQQQAQAAGYRNSYPDALYQVLELDGVAAGRLVTAAVGGTMRVVDIAVIPWARRRGVAGLALRRVQRQAAGEGHDVTLAVRKDNAGARRLYAALGFAPEAEDAFTLQLRWRLGDIPAGSLPGRQASLGSQACYRARTSDISGSDNKFITYKQSKS